MRQLTTEHLAALRGAQAGPCISLYQPTHRSHPDNEQDPIRYRNLGREMEASLRQRYSKRDIRPLMLGFQSLEHDEAFWTHRTEGLAILGSPQTFEVYDLQRPVKELLVVSDSFYTKPLLRVLQSADRYQILSLTLNEARLFEGNRDALDPVDLSALPTTLTEVLGDEVTAARIGVRPAPGGATVYFGAGQRKDEVELDRDRFFRAIDQSILEHYSRPSGLPLILAALPEHQTPFRVSSHNPFLLPEGIHINPEALDLEQLRVLAWKTMEPTYLARLAALIEHYNDAHARHLASDDAAEVAFAAVSGRVATLLVEADRQIPGRLDEASGSIERGDLSDPRIGDLLNEIADVVWRMKGEVIVVPGERMPTDTGLAATYRF